MSAAFQFDDTRGAYILGGPGGDTRYRIVVPEDFVQEEAGAGADADARLEWLRANLPQILAAYTARVEGGWVKAPWDRVLVEETD
jgi:hypothetical protein